MVHVSFPRPIGEVFDYLTDPTNRPEWQSSLRRIEATELGEARVGQTWTDVTSVGARPVMTVTELEAPQGGSASWAEDGVWHGVTARLRLDFHDQGATTLVEADFRIEAPAVLMPLVVVLRKLAPYAVRADLRRAAGVLDRSA